jgi:hypothetical protein
MQTNNEKTIIEQTALDTPEMITEQQPRAPYVTPILERHADFRVVVGGAGSF